MREGLEKRLYCRVREVYNICVNQSEQLKSLRCVEEDNTFFHHINVSSERAFELTIAHQ